ncbi:MAG TPA: acyl-CoA dehydrogenase family protein [Bradyrhizobium sp.]|nr:acyl-CoA dehydrogenase family protein [Bradyrhizobium sp.]
MQTTVSQKVRVFPGVSTEQGNQNDSAQRLLKAVRELVPTLAARAAEVEASRRVPEDIIDVMRANHMFKMLVPASHGGLALSVPDILPVLQTVSEGDASVGWVMMIAAGAQLFSSRMPRALYDEVFGQDPDPMVVGVGTPAGRAEKTTGGYHVTGRWPFSSGCQNAQWICAHCVVWEDGKPVMAGEGPVTRFIVLPAGRWHIEDTWHSSGLAGSGSHHVRIDDVEIPESQTCDLLRDPSCVPGLLDAGVRPFIPMVHAAVAIGIASGAFADLTAVAANGKRNLFATSELRDSTVFQHEVGRLGADLRAVRSLLETHSAALWRRSLEGALDNKADFTEALQSSGWIHTMCTRVVDRCYELAGSAVLTSPLQRRLRDIHMTGQHVFSGERFYAKAGALQLGFPPVDPLSGH